MKSTIKKSTFKAIYRLLDRVSPVPYDCGQLCGSACCMSEDTDPDAFGIYLLPGEEKLFTGDEDWLTWSWDMAEDYDFPDSWHGKVYFIKCNTPPVCERAMRPLQCRTYPLAPHIDVIEEEGERKEVLRLILSDIDAPYSCPLIDGQMDDEEEFGLDERFVKATYTVWKRLIKDPLIHDLVLLDSLGRNSRFKPIYLGTNGD